LRGQGAVSVQRLNGLLTTAAGFRADRGAAVAAVAEAAGKIAEMRLQIMQIDQDMRVEASTMLAEVEAALSGLAERRIAATERLQRVNVVAPQGGRVKDLAVHAPGTVITPAETILLIVPDDDELAVDLEIAPQDIDAIVPGQPVRIRMSALDGRITPEIFGTIMRIGADLSIDPRSGHAFYQVRVAIPPEEFTRLGGQALVPGMPVETFIATGARNVLSYLIRPVRDQMNRALRES
jgi:HlyD family secretion protein